MNVKIVGSGLYHMLLTRNRWVLDSNPPPKTVLAVIWHSSTKLSQCTVRQQRHCTCTKSNCLHHEPG